MIRIKGGSASKKRKKKILKLSKGYRGAANSRFRVAKETVYKAYKKKFISRKLLKRDQRKLWIVRINSFLKNNYNLSYSKFIFKLKNSNTIFKSLNRKILSMLSVNYKEILKLICDKILI